MQERFNVNVRRSCRLALLPPSVWYGGDVTPEHIMSFDVSGKPGGSPSCEAAANAHAAAGGKVTTKLYPGASHGFDGSPEHTRLFRIWDALTVVDCQGFIEPDGSASYDGKGYPNYVGGGNPALATDMNKTCVKKGATVWTNVMQKEAVTRDIIDFLNANM